MTSRQRGVYVRQVKQQQQQQRPHQQPRQLRRGTRALVVHLAFAVSVVSLVGPSRGALVSASVAVPTTTAGEKLTRRDEQYPGASGFGRRRIRPVGAEIDGGNGGLNGQTEDRRLEER